MKSYVCKFCGKPVKKEKVRQIPFSKITESSFIDGVDFACDECFEKHKAFENSNSDVVVSEKPPDC